MKNLSLLKVLIIIIIVLLIGLLIFLGIKYLKKESQEIFSYLGEISQIETDKITISVKAEKNKGLNKDSSVVALLSEQTEIIKIEKPQVLPRDLQTGTSTSIFVRKEISLSDLTVGDEVLISSNSNLKNKTQFEALKIEVTNVKK